MHFSRASMGLLISMACIFVLPGCGAADEETSVSGSETLSAAPAANFPGVPKDYVAGPGGWTHPSCLHEVPDGATVDAERGDVMMGGKLMAHYEPCAYAPMPRSSPPSAAAKAPAGPGFGGWVEDTTQLSGTKWFDYLDVDITVPPAPTQKTPQTLYYFNGLQSTLDGDCGILQPVLQWGVSPAGGGSYWAIGSWWWGNTNQFFSGLSKVATNDLLHMYLYQWNSDQWQVQAVDDRTNASRSIFVNTTCRFNQAFPAVFEVDTGSPITACAQVPYATVVVSNIRLGKASPAWNSYLPTTYSPTSENRIGSTSPRCGWSVSSDATTTYLGM